MLMSCLMRLTSSFVVQPSREGVALIRTFRLPCSVSKVSTMGISVSDDKRASEGEGSDSFSSECMSQSVYGMVASSTYCFSCSGRKAVSWLTR